MIILNSSAFTFNNNSTIFFPFYTFVYIFLTYRLSECINNDKTTINNVFSVFDSTYTNSPSPTFLLIKLSSPNLFLIVIAFLFDLQINSKIHIVSTPFTVQFVIRLTIFFSIPKQRIWIFNESRNNHLIPFIHNICFIWIVAIRKQVCNVHAIDNLWSKQIKTINFIS